MANSTTIDSRRERLDSTKPGEHAGLWLDKYIAQQLRKGKSVSTGQDTPQQKVFNEATNIAEPEEYAQFFERWEQALASAGAQTRVGKVQGRMVVGLGTESVLENSVALHRTYGVPYIPGSALKGLVAAYARKRLGAEWGKGSEAYEVAFGTTDAAGYITFFDALYKPGSGFKNRNGRAQALWLDVMTVHHRNYYQGKDEPPADWDNPTPISFLSATGSYLLALAGPEEWVQATFKILELALKEEGIGAKTSSGYGRLTLDKE